METKYESVCVIMSTYNGEKYFEEQIGSVLKQKKVDVHVYIRDDGSNKDMIRLLKQYELYRNVYVEYGENIGYAKSFLKQTYLVPAFKYYAFCDQDDIWKEDKLYSAIEKMKEYDNIPCLYFSNLTFVDNNINILKEKSYKDMPLEFGNALVRNRISGCTMLFNEELLDISKKVEYSNKNMGSHDSWMYRLCLYVGGQVIYDDNSYIFYRQHENNVTGLKQGLRKRLLGEYNKIFKEKNWRYNLVLTLAESYKEKASVDNRQLTDIILEYRNSLKCKLRLLFNKKVKSGIFVVDLLKNISIILNKF